MPTEPPTSEHGPQCPHCGGRCEATPSADLVQCLDCGRAVSPRLGEAIAACTRLTRVVREEEGVNETLRDDLLERIADHRVWLRERAEVAEQKRAQADAGARGRRASRHPPLPPPPSPTARPADAETPASPSTGSGANEPAPIPPTQGRRHKQVRDIVPRGPSLWARLGPVFAENLLFTLAGFLLIAGAVFFTTTAWTTMSGLTQKLVVALGLLGFAAMVHLAASALARRGGLATPARVLLIVALALVSASAVVAGRLWPESAQMALGTAAFATACGFWFATSWRRREGLATGAIVPAIEAALLLAAALPLAIADASALAPFIAALGSGLAVVGAAFVARRQVRDGVVPRPLWGSLLATALAGAAPLAGLALAHGGPIVAAIAPLGTLLAAAALGLAIVERRSAAPQPTPLTVALATGLAGVTMATGDLRCLTLAAWASAGVALSASLRIERARLLLPALVLSAVGYLFLPAPVRELAMRLRAEAADQLGYAPERLPLSFYGITCLPYLLGTTLLARWFTRRERLRHGRVATGWTVAVALGLCAMSLLLGNDLRAPIAVLGADGAVLVLLGYVAMSPSAVGAGCLAMLAAIACALVHLQATPPATVVTAALATSVPLALAGRSTTTPFAAMARRSYLLAGAVGLAAALAWQLGLCLDPMATTPWSPLHLALALPIVLLRRIEGVPAWAPGAAALPAVWLATHGLAAGGAAIFEVGQSAALPFAWSVTLAVIAALAPRLRHPLVAAGACILALSAWPGLLDGHAARWHDPLRITGAAAVLLASAWLGARSGLRAMAVAAFVALCWPVHLVSHALLAGTATVPFATQDLAAGALAGPALLSLVGTWRCGRDQAMAWASALIALAVAVTLGARRLTLLPDVPERLDALVGIGIVAVLGGLAIVRSLGAAPLRERATARVARPDPVAGAASPDDAPRPWSGAPDPSVWWAIAGLAAALLPVLLLDATVAAMPGYVWGFAGLAALVLALGRGVVLHGYGLSLVAAATGLACLWNAPIGAGGEAWRTAMFATSAALTLACRPPILRGAATLLGLAGGLLAGAVQPARLGLVGTDGGIAIGLLLLALAAWLASQPRFRRRMPAVRGVAAGIAGFAAVALAVRVLGNAIQPGSFDDPAGGVFWIQVAAFVALALATARLLPTVDRRAIALGAAGLAVAVLMPLNLLLDWGRSAGETAAEGSSIGGPSAGARPDLEFAAIAIAVAAAMAPGVRVGTIVAWSLAGLAALLTAGELGELSTPLTATALVAVPVCLMGRSPARGLTLATGLLAIAAAWCWQLHLTSGGGQPMLPAWLSLSAALVGLVGERPLRRLARRRGTTAMDTGTADTEVNLFAAISWLPALFGLLPWALHVRDDATALHVTAACAALAIAATSAGRRTLRPGGSAWLYPALWAATVAYAVLALTTGLLQPLDGMHHHATTLVGATLLLFADRRDAGLRRQMLVLGTALTLGGVALATSLGGLSFSLLAGAAALTVGGAMARTRVLFALALLLANLGLFREWWRHGIFDPSFYGIPAGLSLMFGAELARRALGPTRLAAFRIAGLAVVYGSVLVQVARVAEPWHALALFALGMAAVYVGSRRQQAALLVTGTVAVVLDVVAYLAQRGFEQDFVGSMLLVGAGGALFLVALRGARRRAEDRATPADSDAR